MRTGTALEVWLCSDVRLGGLLARLGTFQLSALTNS